MLDWKLNVDEPKEPGSMPEEEEPMKDPIEGTEEDEESGTSEAVEE